MNRELTSQEKLLIEREFVAREETREKRRLYFSRVFWIGVPAEIVSAFMREFHIGGVIQLFLGLTGLICLLLYTEFLIIPGTFAKDMDLRWHLNPWKDALQRLSAEDRHIHGIIFLASYPLSRMLFSFIAFSLK